jgi:hypothetical protein
MKHYCKITVGGSDIDRRANFGIYTVSEPDKTILLNIERVQ